MRVMCFLTGILLAASMLMGCAIDIGEGDKENMMNNEDILFSLPMTYDLAEAEQKGLADENGFSGQYFRLQAFYAEAIWNMLDTQCGMMELDVQLAEQELRFIPAEEPVNVYQKHWSFGAKYLFLRNNVHIERLSAGQIGTLSALADKGKADSEEAEVFIEDTLKQVISIDGAEDAGEYDAVYELSGLMAPNYAIVLGIATIPEYDADGNYADAENEELKHSVLTALSGQIEQQMNELLGLPVKVFLY